MSNKDGRIFTVGDSAQHNLENGSWVAYHKGEDKKYNYGCFKCHTTGPSEEGSWNGVAADSLGTFSEPGIRCEGCHVPGGDHILNPTVNKLPIAGKDLQITRCGDCHQRGGITNAIPVSGGYIRHHEQLNELRASKHGDGWRGDVKTHIFSINTEAETKEAMFTADGKFVQLVETLIDNKMPSGYLTVKLDARAFASGVYLYRLETGEFASSKKMIFMK